MLFRRVDMKRRELLGLCGGALLSVPGRAAAKDSRELVSTPEKRAQYLKRMLRLLCTDIGPRPAGSKGCEEGARIIQRELEPALPVVALDTFPMTKWEPAGEPELRVGGRVLETYVAQNSPATPDGGAHGTLRKRGDGYEVVDEQSGRAGARINISQYGSRPASSLFTGEDQIARFSVGRRDAGFLEQAAREKLPVSAKAQVRWIPGATTSNVVGTLPGASKDEILMVAHADTQYNTPGANDNTASMIAMLMVAHAMSGKLPRRTMTFLASTGEEINFIGAKHYASVRRDKGTLGDIKVCVNLDSLTYGPNLQITTTDALLEKLILDVHHNLGIRSDPKVFHRDDPMDSAPFRAGGARTVHLNSRGQDDRTLPLYHRPEDRAETVDPALIEDSFRILVALEERLQTVRISEP